MAQLVEDKAVEVKDTLVQELKAIDLWDLQYWRKPRWEPYEKAAFLSRQRRRAEIMRALREPYTAL
jgi:hypothetical protein